MNEKVNAALVVGSLALALFVILILIIYKKSMTMQIEELKKEQIEELKKEIKNLKKEIEKLKTDAYRQ